MLMGGVVRVGRAWAEHQLLGGGRDEDGMVGAIARASRQVVGGGARCSLGGGREIFNYIPWGDYYLWVLISADCLQNQFS